jgi:hypothetical protein
MNIRNSRIFVYIAATTFALSILAPYVILESRGLISTTHDIQKINGQYEEPIDIYEFTVDAVSLLEDVNKFK